SFGGTAACVERVSQRLQALGYEVILFHASGVGGKSLEQLASSGELAGVVDVTTHELADLVVDGVYSAGNARMTGAGAAGLPQVIVPGAIDHSNFWVGQVPDRGLLVEAGSNWRVADFHPGRQPLTRLAEALASALDKTLSDQELGLIEAKLASGPMGLVAWLDEINFPADTNILLFVDQFEEIFRYRQGQSGDEINAFVALFLASAKQRKRRIYVVITMRSDFLGDCAQLTDLAETINNGQFLTPRLTREQCEEATEGPA